MSSKLFLLIIASFLYSVTKAQPISVGITEEPIQFSRGEVTYSGTFSKPKQNGKFPVIVLVSGMGLQDRDWTFIKGKYQLAKLLTEQLTEQGFAVLRYDDRGYGLSTGTKETLTGFDDLVEDVYAAVAALRQRKDVGSIGLMGHSLGGILSVMTASRHKDIDFVITLAGSYQTGGEIMMEQARTLKRWKTSGIMTDDEVVANGQKFVRNWVDYSKGESRGLDTMKSILHNLISYQVRSMSAEDWEKNKKVYKDSSEMIAKVYEEVVGYYTSPHQLSFASYDAVKDLKKVSCPVLVLFGEKDQHVTVKSNLPKVADAIAEAGLAKVTIHIVPGTDHSFSAAGGMQAGKIVPGLVEQITCWLRAAIKK